MSLFGYTLIKKDYLDFLKEQHKQVVVAHEAAAWFSGWKDLNIIWALIFKGDTSPFALHEARDEYAKQRGTDVYGKQR
jgi:hypothetical protein